MLDGQKLKTLFDSEVALRRKMINRQWDLRWDFNMLTQVGGKHTLPDAIFKVKELGSFCGLKRTELDKFF